MVSLKDLYGTFVLFCILNFFFTFELSNVSFLRYIPLCVVFVLRWQLSLTQVKCSSNANGSTYIPYRLLIKMKNIWGPVLLLCNCFLKILYFHQ